MPVRIDIMGISGQTVLNHEDWFIIRDFEEHEEGYTLPKYEAKFVAEVNRKLIDDEIVLIKETDFYGNGDGRMYHVPREVVEDIFTHLP